jgi:ubiquinol-cytochrome c reductase iron-sulfur subunit
MSDQEVDQGKRGFLIGATGVVGGIAAAAAAVPFAGSMLPSERAKAAGAPVEVDIANLAPGEMKIVEWRGKPVWVVNRTKEMLDGITKSDPRVSDPKSNEPLQPEYAKNEFRSIKPEIAVLEGVCSHLGCSPQFKSEEAKGDMGQDWNGGFFCPCHGSKFDFAGRVFAGSPAPVNLKVPPYKFVGDAKIIIGDDSKGA